jgi:hypothetical protein
MTIRPSVPCHIGDCELHPCPNKAAFRVWDPRRRAPESRVVCEKHALEWLESVSDPLAWKEFGGVPADIESALFFAANGPGIPMPKKEETPLPKPEEKKEPPALKEVEPPAPPSGPLPEALDLKPGSRRYGHYADLVRLLAEDPELCGREMLDRLNSLVVARTGQPLSQLDGSLFAAVRKEMGIFQTPGKPINQEKYLAACSKWGVNAMTNAPSAVPKKPPSMGAQEGSAPKTLDDFREARPLRSQISQQPGTPVPAPTPLPKTPLLVDENAIRARIQVEVAKLHQEYAEFSVQQRQFDDTCDKYEAVIKVLAELIGADPNEFLS